MARKIFRFSLQEESKAQLIQRFSGFLNKIRDGKYIISIEKQQRERSGEQNKFYWAVLKQIEAQTGQLSKELHETFKAKHLIDNGARIARIKSTSELNVIEFNQYINKICQEMFDSGIIIEFPEDRS